jgi:hypothetical protein
MISPKKAKRRNLRRVVKIILEQYSRLELSP